MVIVTLWWWVSICVMVDRSGGLVLCGGGDGLLVVVDCVYCGVVRREREREAMRNPTQTQPVAISTYDFYPQHKLQ